MQENVNNLGVHELLDKLNEKNIIKINLKGEKSDFKYLIKRFSYVAGFRATVDRGGCTVDRPLVQPTVPLGLADKRNDGQL